MITKDGKKPEDFTEEPSADKFLKKYDVIV
jgi:hypothetical protein